MKKLLLPILLIVPLLALLVAPLIYKVLAQDNANAGTDISDLQADINDGQFNQATQEQAQLQQGEDDSQAQEGDGQNAVTTDNATSDVPDAIKTESKDNELSSDQQTTETVTPPTGSQPDLGQDVSGQTPDTGAQPAQPVDNSGAPTTTPAPSDQQSPPPSNNTQPTPPPSPQPSPSPEPQPSPSPEPSPANTQPETTPFPEPSPSPEPSPDNSTDQVQGAATRLNIFQRILYFLFRVRR